MAVERYSTTCRYSSRVPKRYVTYLVQVRDGILGGSKICHHKLSNYRREGLTATPLNCGEGGVLERRIYIHTHHCDTTQLWGGRSVRETYIQE